MKYDEEKHVLYTLYIHGHVMYMYVCMYVYVCVINLILHKLLLALNSNWSGFAHVNLIFENFIRL